MKINPCLFWNPIGMKSLCYFVEPVKPPEPVKQMGTSLMAFIARSYSAVNSNYEYKYFNSCAILILLQ